MKDRLALLTLLLFISCSAIATNTVDEFLLAAYRDIGNAGFDDNISGEMGMVSSWIEKAQFRFNAVEETDFNSDRRSQTYEIRVKPKAWGQRGIEKNILKLHLQQQDVQYNLLLSSALKQRYLKILDYLEKKYKTRYLLQLNALKQQEISFLRAQVSSADFNAEKLLRAESTRQQASSMVNLNLKRLNAMQKQLGFAPDSREKILREKGLDWLIDISEILDQLSDVTSVQQSAPELRNARIKMQLAQAETELNKTEQQLGINLLSFEYKDRNQDAMVFQLGVNIPVGTKFSAAESQYELSTAQTQLDNNLSTLQQSLAEIKTEISWLGEESVLIDTQIQHSQQNLRNDYAKQQPLLAIHLRKQMIEQNNRRIEIQQKALHLYVQYLAQSGQLVHQPLHNWIKKGTPVIESSERY